VSVDELLRKGNALLAAGNWNAAIDVYGAALDLAPDHAYARDGLRIAHDMMDDGAAQYAPEDPRHPSTAVQGLVAEGEAAIRGGDLEAGIAKLLEATECARPVPAWWERIADRILHLRPGLLPLAHHDARRKIARGEPRLALHILLPCYRSDPSDRETLLLLALAFDAIDEPDKAAAVRRGLR
jgi:hypothetical protein